MHLYIFKRQNAYKKNIEGILVNVVNVRKAVTIRAERSKDLQ